MNLSLIESLNKAEPRGRRPRTGVAAADALIQLWCLRILTPLGGWTKLADTARLAETDETLLELLALRDWLTQRFGDASPEADALKSELAPRLRLAHETAERQAARASFPDALNANLAGLGEIMALSRADKALVGFSVLLRSDRRLRDCAELLGALAPDRIHQVLSHLLELPEDEIRAALAGHALLNRSGLLTMERAKYASLGGSLSLLSHEFTERMLTEQRELLDIFRGVILPCDPPSLTLDDYPHVKRDLDILHPYLRNALANTRQGVNIFIHGAPGTGKSQLARVLATKLGCGLHEIASEDEYGEPNAGYARLCALYSAQRLLGRQRAMILFDEVEDVFHAFEDNTGLSVAQRHKAWMNRMLEQNPVPTIWVSNRIDHLDAAFIRRFDLVLEIPVAPRRHRESMIRTLAAGLIDDATATRLAESTQLTPAVLARAATVLRSIQHEPLDKQLPETFARLVEATLNAQGCRPLPPANIISPAGEYDTQMVHCTSDLAAIAAGLAKTRMGRLCLYGPPGTGKTAYGRWLAEQLDAPLHVHRVSDLMSAYLGETEKAIAQAFARAEADGAVLMIDEVDSFLRDRQQAQRSWEATQVNEMLTRMESFSGVFIATTNLMRDLDPAALRRFDFKLRFDWLRPEQAGRLLERLSALLELTPPSESMLASLSALPCLTPGDFSAMARRHRIQPFADTAELVSALAAEIALKPESSQRRAGFV